MVAVDTAAVTSSQKRQMRMAGTPQDLETAASQRCRFTAPLEGVAFFLSSHAVATAANKRQGLLAIAKKWCVPRSFAQGYGLPPAATACRDLLLDFRILADDLTRERYQRLRGRVMSDAARLAS
jgi:hypothetical protein